MNSITILTYHTIEPKGSKRLYKNEEFYNITPEKFREQMLYLKKNGYNTITIDEFMNSQANFELPDKTIMLTFDDGHASHYDTVLPILKESGYTGAFFITVNDVEKKYRMNLEEIKILKDSGMDIGSHGMNHKVLSNSSYHTLIGELRSSKMTLEETLKTEILAFSIPRGLYSKKISNVARGLGYMLVFTSYAGNTYISSDPYCLNRNVMIANYSIKDFISIVEKELTFMMKKRMEQFVKNGLQKTIGIRNYDRIKNAVFSN